MKKKHPARWLLLIPCQAVAGILFTILGFVIDSRLFSGAEGQGHGVPIFSVLFLIIAAAVSLVVLVVALAGFAVGMRKK